ncbi:MAG: heme lyase CcmF/NrfE family subunit, partial [Saccharospirillaceae bacterium]|nr:heme lyase CcmF/NrfE family subunit [Pseudomonadales bacterium]NRB80863.1 heme lyase CcmF/NrfE family subunit [Saccharospirillaceae bacterium]
MIFDVPEIGHIASMIAFALASLLAIVPLYGVITGNARLQRSAVSLSIGLFTFVVISYICLTYAFVVDDFTVTYVQSRSALDMPFIFKLTGVWGGHEGSLLLWILMQSGWIFAVSIFSRSLSYDTLAATLSTMGFICAGFLAFMLFTSNPFERELLTIIESTKELNPALQDFAFIIHPPMLYMGYVGFSVAFGFAMAALITGRLDTAWARWARPWTNLAWVFLTGGIMLGSWWAYYELGWGGWWFWDPVENASFMPWLMGTALIHSLAVTEKRGAFRSWTVLLALGAFSYSLIGTFIVRSGLLTSVHAFASDSSRGFFILGILAVTIFSALVLFAIRGRSISSQVRFEFFSRESFLLINNLLLTVISFGILIGTGVPLLADLFSDQDLSVGAPVFNWIFGIGVILIVMALSVGQLLRWKKNKFEGTSAIFVWGVLSAMTFAVLYALLCLVIERATPLEETAIETWLVPWEVVFGWLLVALLLGSCVRTILHNTRNAQSTWLGMKKLQPSFWGMQFAHVGVAISIIGVVMVQGYETEDHLLLKAGDIEQKHGYVIQFNGVKPYIHNLVMTSDNLECPHENESECTNYIDQRGEFIISKNGKV